MCSRIICELLIGQPLDKLQVGEKVHIQKGMFGRYISDHVAVVQRGAVQCLKHREWLIMKDVVRFRAYDPTKGKLRSGVQEHANMTF